MEHFVISAFVQRSILSHFEDLLIKLTYDHIYGISQLDQAAVTMESDTISVAKARPNLTVIRLKRLGRVVLWSHSIYGRSSQEVGPSSVDRTND